MTKLKSLSTNPDVVIVGAGIIGLSIGWRLSKEGKKVVIFEARKAGRQASWAAAGMLAPYCETLFFNNEGLDIAKKSMALYPQFLSDLSADSGCAIPDESQGTLCVAITRDDHEWLKHQYEFRAKHGMPAHWLSGDEVKCMEPLLSPRVNCGVWIPAESQVDNRLIVLALIEAFKRKGGQLIEQVNIAKTIEKNGQAVGVLTDEGSQISAKCVVIAAGAWSGQIQTTPSCNIYGGIRPIKGQSMLLKVPQHFPLKVMIRSPRVYLAPKTKGSVYLGATSNDHGFDDSVTAGAVIDLLQYGKEILPGITEYQIDEMISGFRPITNDHMPIIGRSGVKGLYSATGHGRSGILLTPYTAHCIKNLIMEDCFNEDKL